MQQKPCKWAPPIAAFAALWCGLASIQAQASQTSLSPGYCSSRPDLSRDDVTYNQDNANDCYGVVSGNINGASVINGLNLTWGNDWSYLDGTDSGSGTYQGIRFTVAVITAPDDTTEGTWRLTGIDTNGSAPLNLPATLDLAVALKASDRYALWYFDNVTFTGTANGEWEIEFKNKGGRHPALSHMMIFGRDGQGALSPASCGTPVPVPAAAWLLGSGLLGLGAALRGKS